VSNALFSIYAGFNTWQHLQYFPGSCLATVLTACCTKTIQHKEVVGSKQTMVPSLASG